MSSAVISFGPNWGLLTNSSIGGQYVDQFRLLLQNLDALLYTKCINATQVVPPTNPNPGDSYLLLNVPSGVWTGHQSQVAFWDAQLTASGSNTLTPGWVFIAPQPGMLVFNVATAQFLFWNGTAWTNLSTIISGTVPIAQGGTGATTAAAALTNLGQPRAEQTLTSPALPASVRAV